MANSSLQETKLDKPTEEDPLWSVFRDWLSHREVTPHAGEELRTWIAFRAGADAEHARIAQCFKDANICIEERKTT